MTEIREEDLARFSKALGYEFGDRTLAVTALTHPSYSYENEGGRGNERLEFLGDAVIDLVVAQLLFEAHPEWAEGELTRARRALVNTRNLAIYARSLELGSFVRLGRGERRSGGADKERLLGNLFEAVIGAIYLDGGLAPVMEFVRTTFGDAVASGGTLPEHDPKTRLQEWSMATYQRFPDYGTIGDSGIENDAQRFRVEVRIDGQSWGSGTGRTKRDAEQQAASQALARAESTP